MIGHEFSFVRAIEAITVRVWDSFLFIEIQYSKRLKVSPMLIRNYNFFSVLNRRLHI